MRVLIVKTSSLGDIVHCFPAITDAVRACPDIRLDWLVEQAFVPIATLHPAVQHVIPVGLRRWRHHPWRSRTEVRNFLRNLRAARYDLVLDAQGLVKSAVLTRLARGGIRAGPNRASAREPLAGLLYGRGFAMPADGHAIDRLRTLFAAALGYRLDHALDFGLVRAAPAAAAGTGAEPARPVVLLHGTSWASKAWPVAFWRHLAERAAAAGYPVLVPWGSEAEHADAETIAAGQRECRVAPRQSLGELAGTLGRAAGVVTVDTGLGHLAAAFGVPTVGLYGATDPARTGLRGHRAVNLQSTFTCAPCLARHCRLSAGATERDGDDRISPPCFAELTPDRAWTALASAMAPAPGDRAEAP
jgi:heptosyltransferase I